MPRRISLRYAEIAELLAQGQAGKRVAAQLGISTQMNADDPTVYVVDDDDAVRSGLCALLASVHLPTRALATGPWTYIVSTSSANWKSAAWPSCCSYGTPRIRYELPEARIPAAGG